MEKIKSINQICISLNNGHGVSNSILYMQKLLQDLGYISNIYILNNYSDINVKHYLYSIKEYPNDNSIAIVHFEIGFFKKDLETIFNINNKKILYFHNITPSHFFYSSKYIERVNVGRVQLKTMKKNFIAAFTNSDYTLKELIYRGYYKVFALPTLVDFNRFTDQQYDNNILNQYRNSFNIIFVGRVIQSKVQHQLINIAYQLKLNNISNFKLFLLGENSYTDYYNYIIHYMKSLDLSQNVIITNKITNEELNSYYKIANLYISVSEHEGFGMPMVEAIYNNIPVLAYNTTAIPYVIGNYGLINFKNADFFVKVIQQYMVDENLRNQLLQKQKEYIRQKFSKETIIKQLKHYLEEVIN
jgi:glycosyltransferase involved in cell wall biosynthesis